MAAYNVVSAEAENKRLEIGVSVIRAYMDGKSCLAPIDTGRSNLRVLDSAASNGAWLSQLQASLQDPGSATLIGTDIQDRFPDPPHPGITLQIQDITEPWPESWRSSFDFVHQTLVIYQAGPKLRKVLGALTELVKPGGWIELMEPQYGFGDDGGPAYKQFGAMVNELWDLRGTKSDFASDLEPFLKDAGFVDVKTVVLSVGVGPKAKSPDIADITVQSMIGGGKNIPLAAKRIPGGFKCISSEDLETWPTRLEEELKTEGAVTKMLVVYGRKPDV